MSNEIMSDNLLIPYLKDGKWGFCDRNKKLIIQNRFDNVNLFTKHNVAIVEYNKKKFIIDKKGVSISKLYDYISIINEKIAIINEHNKLSAINLNGKQILAWYDRIGTRENIDLLFCYINESCFIFDFNGISISNLNVKDINYINTKSNKYFNITLANNLLFYVTKYNNELFISNNEDIIIELSENISNLRPINFYAKNMEAERRINRTLNYSKTTNIDNIFTKFNLFKKQDNQETIKNDISLITKLCEYLTFSTHIESKLKTSNDLVYELEIEEHTSKAFDYDENLKETIHWKKIYTKQKLRLLGQQVDSHFNIAKHGYTYNHNFSMYAAEMLIEGEYQYNDYGEIINKQTLIGFINNQGKQITPYIFYKIQSFNNEKNIAIAENKDGAYIITPNSIPHKKINNEITLIRLVREYIIIRIGNFYGVIDIYFNLITPLIYDLIIDFHTETETFIVELNQIRLHVNIDGEQFTDKAIQRKIINNTEYTNKFNETLLITYLEQIKMYVITDSNNNQLSSLFEDIQPLRFSKLAKVKFNGKFGLINESGKLIVQCKYDKLVELNENITEAYILNRKVYIDINGKEYTSKTIPNDSTEFKLTQYSLDNKWGFIDNSENVIVPCYYEYVEEFDDNELSIVTFMSRKCLIDKNGVQRTSWYKSIERLDRNIYIVESGHGFWIIKGYEDKRLTVKPYSSINLIKTENNWYIINSRGCLNTNYEQKIGCIYSKIEYFNEKLFKVYKNKNWGYVNHEGIVCWEYIEPITDINDDDYDYQEHNNSNEISARDAFDDDEQYEDWLNQ